MSWKDKLGAVTTPTEGSSGGGGYKSKLKPVTGDVAVSSAPQATPQSLGQKAYGAVKGTADFINQTVGKPFIDLAAIPVQLLAKATNQPDPFADKALGGVDVAGVDQPLRKAGSALEAGSYVAPVGLAGRAVAAPLKPLIGKTAAGFLGNVAAGAGTGYGVDVGMNLSDGKPLEESLTPGLGTALGGALPFVPPVLRGGRALANKSASFATSQATGLAPETISQITKTPEAFSRTAIREADRGDLAKDVVGAISKERKAVSDTGKLYEPLRTAQGTVNIPQTTTTDILQKYGLSLGRDGKIAMTAESRPMSQGDVKHLEDFISQYGAENLSNNAFFNAKQRLSQLSKYEQGRADTFRSLARDLRGAYEAAGDKQISGLKELDEKFAPIRKQLNALQKDYLNADGTLKDGAATKIANLTNRGREQILARLEQARPGVTKEINVLRAIEDIQNASGIKVGTYARAGLGVGALMTGNIPAAIAAVVSQPEIAVQLLRGMGYTNRQMATIARLIKNNLGDVLELAPSVGKPNVVIPGVPGLLNGNESEQPSLPPLQ